MYKEKELVGEEDTCDPIKDLDIFENFAFTVRDLDLIITEFKPGTYYLMIYVSLLLQWLCFIGDKLRPTTKKTLVGKAPVTVAGGNYLVFASRSGKDILVHENSIDSQFKRVAELNVRTKLINWHASENCKQLSNHWTPPG